VACQTHKAPKGLSKKHMKKPEIYSNSRWLAQLGPSHTQRAQAIETHTATLTSTYFADLSWFDKKEPVEAFVMFEASRNLAGMDNRESTCLKFVELLNGAADGKDATFRKWRTALLWVMATARSPVTPGSAACAASKAHRLPPRSTGGI
jgi:hypothetical protein